jgi:hypothetical protein
VLDLILLFLVLVLGQQVVYSLVLVVYGSLASEVHEELLDHVEL